MEALLIYFLKMTVTSGVMFLYYQLFLKDKTFHHYNRFYLLSVVVISLLLPLLKMSYFTMEVNSSMYQILNPIEAYSSENQIDDGFVYYSMVMSVVGLVALFLCIHLAWGVLKINQLKQKYPRKNIKGISFYNTDLENAPFSFFKNLFWRENILLDSDLGQQILKHEMVHIEQKHTYDKLFVEVVQRLFWLNPVFYFIKKELNLIHEYLADKKMLKNTHSKAFAEMLLETHFSTKKIPMTNPFLQSNLKKRLKMLQKSTTKHTYLRKLAVLPVLFTITFALLVNAKNKEIKIINQHVNTIHKSTKKDTVREKVDVNYSVRYGYEESNSDKKKMKNAYQQILKDAKSRDVFKIEDKTVGKKEFKKFMKKHYQDKNFNISYTKKDKNKDAIYKASTKKFKMPPLNKNNKTAIVEVNATLSDVKIEDNLKDVNDDNTNFYVNDEKVSKSVYQKFITKNQGKDGFEMMFSKSKQAEKGVYSTAINKSLKKGVKINKRHQNFFKNLKLNKKNNEKKDRKSIDLVNLKADKIVLMASDRTNVMKADKSLKNKNFLFINVGQLHSKKPITKLEGRYLTEDKNESIKYTLDGKELSNKEVNQLISTKFKRINVRSDKKLVEIFTK